MQHVVVIVAGGSGKRFGSELPKQFIEIKGKPVIFHTIEKFLAFDLDCHFIIALQEEYQDYWKDLLDKHQFKFSHEVSKAGEERFYTVKNALELVPINSKVGIHDAVRPLVSQQTIKNCLEGLSNNEAVIPVVPVVNSLRKITETGSESVNREEYKMVQTPQYFISNKIKESYNVGFKSKFTDDASVYEDQMGPVKLVDGNPENIKITNQQDLAYISHIL